VHSRTRRLKRKNTNAELGQNVCPWTFALNLRRNFGSNDEGYIVPDVTADGAWFGETILLCLFQICCAPTRSGNMVINNSRSYLSYQNGGSDES